jgi:hypothetical protein
MGSSGNETTGPHRQIYFRYTEVLAPAEISGSQALGRFDISESVGTDWLESTAKLQGFHASPQETVLQWDRIAIFPAGGAETTWALQEA